MKTLYSSLLLSLGLLLANNSSGQTYQLTDLGATVGPNSYAQGINNQGQVVGYWETTNGAHAFLYQAGAVTDLGPLGLGVTNNNYALSINNAGQVVGFSETTSGVRAFLYQNGIVTNLADLAGMDSYAFGLNQSGQIVGHVATAAGAQAFLYDRGSAIALGTLGGANSFAYGLNNLLQVAGTSLLAGNSTTHAFLWQNGTLADLNQIQVYNNAWELHQAHAINDLGSIVGRGAINDQEHAFLFSSGGVVTDLGVLPGGNNSYALGLNNSNQIVGASATGTGKHAVVWQAGIINDLNLLINVPGWVLHEACGINDQGQIVGWGTVNGQTHACLLTPLDAAPLATAKIGPVAGGKSRQNAAPVMAQAQPVATGVVHANTAAWFVNQAGNNGYNGQAAVWNSGVTGPFKTINHALGQPLAGNIVNVAAGTYSENVDLRGKNVQVQIQGRVTLH